MKLNTQALLPPFQGPRLLLHLLQLQPVLLHLLVLLRVGHHDRHDPHGLGQAGQGDVLLLHPHSRVVPEDDLALLLCEVEHLVFFLLGIVLVGHLALGSVKLFEPAFTFQS